MPEMANHAREFHYNFKHTKPEDVGFCYDVHWVWKGRNRWMRSGNTGKCGNLAPRPRWHLVKDLDSSDVITKPSPG
jgi:hypothetical protein